MSERDGSASRETARSRGAHAPDRDPRDIVTEHAFRVDRDLLGVTLAGPFRRLFAMLADLFLVALLLPFRAAASSLLGDWIDFVVAAVVAWFLFRMASGRGGEGPPRRAVRLGLRVGAVVVLLIGTVDLAGTLLDGEDGAADGDPSGVVARMAEMGIDGPSGADGLGGVSAMAELAGSGEDWRALATASSPEEARPVAHRLARRLDRAGMPPERIADVLAEVMAEGGTAGDVSRGVATDTGEATGQTGGDDPAAADTAAEGEAEAPAPPGVRAVAREAAAAVDTAWARERGEERASADSLARRYVTAVAAGDSAEADSLRGALRTTLAGREIEELEADIEELEDENDELEDRVDRLESPAGFLSTALDRISDDLGVGFGTLGLYFVAFLAVWDGRTPGKRLLGVRVVKLDGKPMGWWDSLGRFGGLAAGPATGFLGWAQVFWDPNRQGIHDKVASTVVIRTRGTGKRYRRE